MEEVDKFDKGSFFNITSMLSYVDLNGSSFREKNSRWVVKKTKRENKRNKFEEKKMKLKKNKEKKKCN